jgi:hypothetical protein
LSVNGLTDGQDNVTEISLSIGDEPVIGVHGPAGYRYLGYIIIEGDPPQDGIWGDDIGAAVANKYYVKSGYPVIYDGEGGAPAGNLASCIRYSYAGWGWGYELSVDDTVSNDNILGGKQFEYMFHCTGLGDVSITLWEDYGMPDAILIHQVPEPATIMLLGLGGLLLRRRK